MSLFHFLTAFESASIKCFNQVDIRKLGTQTAMTGSQFVDMEAYHRTRDKEGHVDTNIRGRAWTASGLKSANEIKRTERRSTTPGGREQVLSEIGPWATIVCSIPRYRYIAIQSRDTRCSLRPTLLWIRTRAGMVLKFCTTQLYVCCYRSQSQDEGICQFLVQKESKPSFQVLMMRIPLLE